MSKRTAFILLVAFVLVGFVLRVHRLAALPFRGDEAFTAQYWAGLPLRESLANIATIEPHPVLTYALFRVWGITAGINEFTLRLLPTLFNILAIPALYATGTQLKKREIGVLAALLFAVNPYQIWHSQDARNYAIWVGLSAITLWLGLRVIHKKHRAGWLFYALAATITSFTFYFELIFLSALSGYALVSRWRNWRFIRIWGMLHGAIFIAVGASFLILQGALFQRGAYGGTIGSADPLRFFATLLFGETMPQTLSHILTTVIVIGSGLCLILVWRQKQRFGFLSIMAIMPTALLGILSLKADILHPRYVLPVAGIYMLLFSSALISTVKQRPLYRLLSVVLLLWLAISAYSLYLYFSNPAYNKSQNWAALAGFLRNNVTAGDLVIQTAVDAAFGYYYDAPAQDIALPQNPLQPAEEINTVLLGASAVYDSLWAVGRTFADWPNAGVVETWLNDHMQPVRDVTVYGLPARQFMRWEVRADEITQTPLATFTNTAQLVGVRVFPAPTSDDEITIWLYWRALEKTTAPLKIFVHMVGVVNPDTGSPLWTQDDQFPQDGRISTTDWALNTVYRDVYHLARAAVVPGNYQLITGFYDPERSTRIAVNDSDHYTFSTITVE